MMKREISQELLLQACAFSTRVDSGSEVSDKSSSFESCSSRGCSRAHEVGFKLVRSVTDGFH